MGSNNKTIARNTAFLYVRMVFIMLVMLYTSRVILQVLGVDDYGLYQAIGGIVGFLAFISNALSTATSRFIMFALGTGKEDELKNTFAMTFTAHIIIGFIIVLLSETVGLWYVYNKMVIPEYRFTIAVIVYHISIVTAFIAVVQVPFHADIIAHEKMSVFAYIGIVEAVSKLGIIYLLNIGGVDKLILYASLLLLIQFCVFSFNIVYCSRHFVECGFGLYFDRKKFGNIFSFSGWSLFANGAIALSNQGILLLLNLFFTPAVVAARSVSLQVSNAANQLVQSFRTAVNPQIVKRYAGGDKEGSKSLLLESTKYSYFLMLIIALPLFMLAEPILSLWLVEVPEYTVIFLQIVIVQSLFQVFDTSFYTALYSKGRIRENAILSPLMGFACFPIVYLLFKNGASPVALSWAYLVNYAILGLVIKPILINKIADYGWDEITSVYRVCLIVTLVSVPVPLYLYVTMGVGNIKKSLILLLVSLLSVAVAVWTFGLTKHMKNRLLTIIKSRLYKIKLT